MGGHAGIGQGEDNVRPDADKVLQDIADYVHNYKIDSKVAYDTARLVLLDSLGCAMEALRFLLLPTSAVPLFPALLSPTVPVLSVPTTSLTPSVPLSTTVL